LIRFQSYLRAPKFELEAVDDFEWEKINQLPDSTMIDRNVRLLCLPILEWNHIIILIIEPIIIDMIKVPCDGGYYPCLGMPVDGWRVHAQVVAVKLGVETATRIGIPTYGKIRGGLGSQGIGANDDGLCSQWGHEQSHSDERQAPSFQGLLSLWQ